MPSAESSTVSHNQDINIYTVKWLVKVSGVNKG